MGWYEYILFATLVIIGISAAVFLGNKVYNRRQGRRQRDAERGGGGARASRVSRRDSRNTDNGTNAPRRARRNSILAQNPVTLSTVPEDEEDDGFIFTITNRRGEARPIGQMRYPNENRRPRAPGFGGSTTRRDENRPVPLTARPVGKLTDAQRLEDIRIGSGPPQLSHMVLDNGHSSSLHGVQQQNGKKKNSVTVITSSSGENSSAAHLNRIKCSNCRKRFDTKEEMEMHRDMQHFNKFTCDVCRKEFSTQSSLWKHVKSHSQVRPYVCDVCDKGFTQLANLQRHLQCVHNGLKPFHCPICDKNFSQHANMLKHQLLHSGQKPYKCSNCDKAFAQRANLKKHEMIHNGVKPHSCPICFKSYSQFVNLKKHLLTHSKNKGKGENNPGSYECVICKATFDTYDEYKPHMKVSCRRRVDPVTTVKKEPPPLADENSLLLNGGLMMSEGLISAADVIGHPIAHHLHHHLHPHHQASPGYILT